MKIAVPDETDFRSRLRGPQVAARVGLWLGICFGIAFVTGVISHWAQQPDPWLPVPTRPVWGYRVTQGLHVIAGTAAVPLLLVKLWSVFPRLFARPPRDVRRLVLHGLERASIGALVAASIFQLASGLANSAQWYPWAFSFRATHYAVAWVAVGALVVHIAVKLPVIREAFATDVEEELQGSAHGEPAGQSAGEPAGGPVAESGPGLSRRGLLRSTWWAAGVAVLATAGGTVPLLRRVSVLATRTGDGPQGLPVNKTAAAAGVVAAATSEAFRLVVVHGGREVSLRREDLEALPQVSAELPIACVEGWSASASWTGVRVREVLDLVEAPGDRAVRVESLQPSGPFRATTLPADFAEDDLTLLALEVNGEPLSLDHGFPVRLIAPNRPGVLQTKWVTRLEVLA